MSTPESPLSPPPLPSPTPPSTASVAPPTTPLSRALDFPPTPPTVQAPAVQAPTVLAPIVLPPIVLAPTVQVPTVQAPTVQAPTVQIPAGSSIPLPQPDTPDTPTQANASYDYQGGEFDTPLPDPDSPIYNYSDDEEQEEDLDTIPDPDDYDDDFSNDPDDNANDYDLKPQPSSPPLPDPDDYSSESDSDLKPSHLPPPSPPLHAVPEPPATADLASLPASSSMASSSMVPPAPPPASDAIAAAASVITDKQKLLKNPALQNSPASSYILGTLVVRVVAGRDIPAALAGGWSQILSGGATKIQQSNSNNSRSQRVLRAFASGSSNPFTRISFDGTTQQMSQQFETCDPVWQRESAFFDVILPTEALAIDEEHYLTYVPPCPLLQIELLHTDEDTKSAKKLNSAKAAVKKDPSDPSNTITPLGTVKINTLDLLTGKSPPVDTWVDLPGQGSLRVTIEYEAAEDPPRAGDLVRLNGFCSPRDLHPIPIGRLFEVDDVEGDNVILSYTTEEDWSCTFCVHRFCCISAVRHQRALEQYQDQILDLAQKLTISPLVDTLVDVYQTDLVETGLLGVSAKATAGALNLATRWWNSSSDAVLEDLKYATNWDGRVKVEEEDDDEEEDDESNLKREDEYEAEGDDVEALPSMPCCPITKMPMVAPVVAADGHTYEKKAIVRWLESSDVSPLTGQRLPHKEVITNFALLQQCQDDAIAEAGRLVDEELELKESVKVEGKAAVENLEEIIGRKSSGESERLVEQVVQQSSDSNSENR